MNILIQIPNNCSSYPPVTLSSLRVGLIKDLSITLKYVRTNEWRITTKIPFSVRRADCALFDQSSMHKRPSQNSLSQKYGNDDEITSLLYSKYWLLWLVRSEAAPVS